MPPSPASISTTDLNGTNGFAARDLAASQGLTVVAQGDVNGDGFTDFVMTAPGLGTVYVVYGRAGGVPATTDLGTLNGLNGFTFDGPQGGNFGTSIAVADFDGDGFADVAIGDPQSDEGGRVVVMFGRASWTNIGAHVPVDGLGEPYEAVLTGPRGFGSSLGVHTENLPAELGPPAAVLEVGNPASHVIDTYLFKPNDFDGRNSLNIGRTTTLPEGDGFGSVGNCPTSHEYGAEYYDATTHSPVGDTPEVADWCGDGIGDQVCTAPLADLDGETDCGAAFIVCGQTGPIPQTVDVSTLDGTIGCLIHGAIAGEEMGRCYTEADVNGDGKLDIVLGAKGAVYVILNPSAGFTPSGFDVSTLDGTNGFKLVADAAGDDFGCSVASAGDWNGDGIEDLVIGARNADGGMGAAYVFFGHATFGQPNYVIGSFANGTDGTKLTGSVAGGFFGSAVDPGDFNHDGFSDIGIAAPGAGSAYMFFGGKPGEAVTRNGTVIGQTIHGGDFGDTLNGLGGNDVLFGHGGADTLNGGTGFDLASYADKTSSVMVTLNGGTNATVSVGGVSEDTVKNIEGIVGGSASDTLTGDASNNWFRGGSGLDVIDGGAGSDTADYGDKTGNLFISLNDGVDTVVKVSNITDDTLRNIENIIGGSGNDYIGGNSSVNILRGGAGNDTLYGSDGDSLYGGDGNDQLTGGGTNEMLDGGDGVDTADFSGLFNQTLTLTLSSKGASTAYLNGVAATKLINVENIFSSFSNDTITGNSFDNVINGGTGQDTLDGRGGIDTLSYQGRGDSIAVTLAGATAAVVTANGTAEDTIRNFENVIGGNGADTLNGDGNANVLTGNGGIDTLNGNGGADTLIGGTGNDSENGGAGNDRFIDDTGTDVMDGGTGSDTLSYGERFHVFGGSIVVTLNGATDAVVSVGGIAEDTIRNIENIFGGLSNDTLTGDGLNNMLFGGTPGVTTSGDGSDTLSGMGGNDVLDGGMTGNDVMDGGAGNDTASFAMALSGVTVNLGLAGAQNTIGAGSDTLIAIENLLGSGYADTLTGNSGANVLTGAGGNDKLVGGAGADKLIGGAGSDTLFGSGGKDIFVFQSIADNAPGAADRIADFVQGDDRIDLRAIDAVAGGADNAFGFIGSVAFGHIAGELRYDMAAGKTTISGDVDGDALADFTIVLGVGVALAGTDFLL